MCFTKSLHPFLRGLIDRNILNTKVEVDWKIYWDRQGSYELWNGRYTEWTNKYLKICVIILYNEWDFTLLVNSFLQEFLSNKFSRFEENKDGIFNWIEYVTNIQL